MSWQTACHKCGRRIRETMTPICDECAAAEGGLLDAKLAPTSAPANPAWSLAECRERVVHAREILGEFLNADSTAKGVVMAFDRERLLAMVDRMAVVLRMYRRLDLPGDRQNVQRFAEEIVREIDAGGGAR